MHDPHHHRATAVHRPPDARTRRPGKKFATACHKRRRLAPWVGVTTRLGRLTAHTTPASPTADGHLQVLGEVSWWG